MKVFTSQKVIDNKYLITFMMVLNQ